MTISVDTSKAEAKVRSARKWAALGRGLSTKAGAEVLARELRAKAPMDTGHLRASVIVQKRGKKWFAVIPRNQFPARIFYPVTVMPQLRAIVRQASIRALTASTIRFLSFWRNRDG